ncbi:MAG: hypothetical protein IJS31_02455 [Oscillospiraceae bacterium]|nr:hypothetical protein [Oscillospiraceae bacterium]
MDYKSLYYKLFAKVADATDALELGNSELAYEILVEAQQSSEESFLQMDDPNV